MASNSLKALEMVKRCDVPCINLESKYCELIKQFQLIQKDQISFLKNLFLLVEKHILIYIPSFIFLSLHLMHGFQSAFQSVGFSHSKYTPILKKLGFNATCFIVTNKIGQYNDWDINNNNFKKMKLMNLDQINEGVLNGFDVGSHSMDHLDLPKLNKEEKVNQIFNSKKFLNDMLNINTETFAYPYGSYDIESSDIVKRYYEFAVTTRRSRYIKEKFNNELLPRIPISKDDNLLKFFLKIKTPYEDIKFKD
jgi:hypothetical protein